MNTWEELEEFIRNGHQLYMSQLTIECVIFGYHDRHGDCPRALLKKKSRFHRLQREF
jgi:hypothetical protein